MDKTRLTVGLIGAGGIAGAHVQALLQLKERFELVALADSDPAKARQLAEENGVQAEVYADYRRMLERDDLDIAAVCTPPYAREELVVAALAAGKHVMCEKPFASSLQEWDRMIEAARTHGRKLAVMLQTRCDTDVRRTRHVVASGGLGPVLFASAYNHHWRGDAYYRKAWRGTWEMERGGTLMNLGIHTLDVFLWVLGELEGVKADIASLGHDGIETEDIASALLTFRSGTLAQFVCTTTHSRSGSGMAFSGKSASVDCPLAFAAVGENAEGFPLEDREAAERLARIAGEVEPVVEGFAGPYDDLFAAIRDDREPLTGGASVRRTLEAITAIYKAATLGGEVRLPIAPEDPWYTTEGLHRLVKKRQRP